MRKTVTSIPFAVVVSLVLIGTGSVLASDGLWAGKLALGITLFIGIAYTGFAIRRSKQRH